MNKSVVNAMFAFCFVMTGSFCSAQQGWTEIYRGGVPTVNHWVSAPQLFPRGTVVINSAPTTSTSIDQLIGGVNPPFSAGTGSTIQLVNGNGLSISTTPFNSSATYLSTGGAFFATPQQFQFIRVQPIAATQVQWVNANSTVYITQATNGCTSGDVALPGGGAGGQQPGGANPPIPSNNQPAPGLQPSQPIDQPVGGVNPPQTQGGTQSLSPAGTTAANGIAQGVTTIQFVPVQQVVQVQSIAQIGVVQSVGNSPQTIATANLQTVPATSPVMMLVRQNAPTVMQVVPMSLSPGTIQSSAFGVSVVPSGLSTVPMNGSATSYYLLRIR